MTPKEKEFLILRSQGLSFDAITTKLKVSKPTLVKWSKIYQDEIQDLKTMDLLALKEKYQFTQKKTYERLLKQLDKVEHALTTIDFTKLSIKDLLLLKDTILNELKQIEDNANFINVGLDEITIYEDLNMTRKQLVNINETII